MVFSENGIIAKAREAAEKTNQAAINEQEDMNRVADYMSNMVNGTGGSTPEEPSGPEMPDGWDENRVNAVESADGIVVPVPKGYTASSVATENTVADGFVIYEGEEVVNDSNKDTAQTTRNQFVWVPVANPSEMYGTDSTGKKWGKLYYFDEEGITPRNWTEQDGVISVGNYGCCEPDVITGSDDASYDAISTNLQQAGLSASATVDTFKTQLETEFNSMIESVEKYGGFYIGRYETGKLSQDEVVVVKNNTNINNYQSWYTQYKKAKGIAANDNVTTTMIWGSQWDATLRWMYNQGGEKKIYTYDSTGKGNYGTGSPIATGSNESYAVNNIYDMAGNGWDWTIEAIDTSYRVYRGGYYYINAILNPASDRDSAGPASSYGTRGSRLALYM